MDGGGKDGDPETGFNKGDDPSGGLESRKSPEIRQEKLTGTHEVTLDCVSPEGTGIGAGRRIGESPRYGSIEPSPRKTHKRTGVGTDCRGSHSGSCLPTCDGPRPLCVRWVPDGVVTDVRVRDASRTTRDDGDRPGHPGGPRTRDPL